jgi:uncharacterized protein with PIN domain
MLGTLAKWLRLLGYDACFDPALDDNELVRRARAEDRVLLTRDHELARRPGVRALLIEPEALDEQVRQVVAELHLTPEQAFSRCPVCNEVLALLDAEAARERVPAYVAQTHDTFKICPACQRVYWRGTHWQQMETFLGHIKNPKSLDGG